jgi:hypothetical protein
MRFVWFILLRYDCAYVHSHRLCLYIVPTMYVYMILNCIRHRPHPMQQPVWGTRPCERNCNITLLLLLLQVPFCSFVLINSVLLFHHPSLTSSISNQSQNRLSSTKILLTHQVPDYHSFVWLIVPQPSTQTLSQPTTPRHSGLTTRTRTSPISHAPFCRVSGHRQGWERPCSAQL